MKRKYEYEYDTFEAEVHFVVDDEKFTEEDAKVLLEFFTWEYDQDANPVDELMEKYAMKAIWVANANGFNEYGVKCWFEESEGFLAIDGSKGVELVFLSGFEFDESLITLISKETI